MERLENKLKHEKAVLQYSCGIDDGRKWIVVFLGLIRFIDLGICLSLKLGKVGKGVDDKMNKLGLEFEDIEVTEKHLKQILSPHFRFNQ